jgi:hypothetical protein
MLHVEQRCGMRVDRCGRTRIGVAPGSSMTTTSLCVSNARSKLSTTSFVNVAMPHSRGGNVPMKSAGDEVEEYVNARYCKGPPFL